MHIDTMSMELAVVYFKMSKVELSKLRHIAAPEGKCFNLSKQCLFLSQSSLFARVRV